MSTRAHPRPVAVLEPPGGVSAPDHLRPAARAERVALAGLMLAAALGAVLVARLSVPLLSIDDDDVVYRLQAQAIAHGHLFPPLPAEGPARSFQPWLVALVDGRYVPKYPPIVPALFAASRVVTGGDTAALALVAAGVVAAAYALARELLGHPREALLAAGLLAISPLVVVQSGLLLAYLPVLLLLLLAWWGLARGTRTGSVGTLAGAGLAGGLAAAARPFDAVLVLGPTVGWAALSAVRAGGRQLLLRRLVVAGVPVAVVGASLLGYDTLATGNPFRLPFGLLSSSDALGYGGHRLVPEDSVHHFGPIQGLSGVGHLLLSLVSGWAAGGLLLVALALVPVVRRQASGALLAFGASALTVPVGYLFFWGSWNASVLWGGTRLIGPFYLLPAVVPLAVLGARGLTDLARWRRGPAVAAAAIAVALSAALVGVVVTAQTGYTARNRALAQLVATAGPDALVYVSGSTPYLGSPAAAAVNPATGARPRPLYAVAYGSADLDVAARMPSRPAYLLQVSARFANPRQPDGAASLVRLREWRGLSVPLTLTLPSSGGGRLTVDAFGRRQVYFVYSGTGTLTLTVTRTAVTVSGAGQFAVPAVERIDGKPSSVYGIHLGWGGVDGVGAGLPVAARPTATGVAVMAGVDSGRSVGDGTPFFTVTGPG